MGSFTWFHMGYVFSILHQKDPEKQFKFSTPHFSPGFAASMAAMSCRRAWMHRRTFSARPRAVGEVEKPLILLFFG
jgi:hypothetical protein